MVVLSVFLLSVVNVNDVAAALSSFTYAHVCPPVGSGRPCCVCNLVKSIV